MRKIIMLVVAAGLAGCQGAQSTPVATATGHAALVASLNGAYVWNCSMAEAQGRFPTRFVLARQIIAGRPEMVLLVAGRSRGEVTEVTRVGAAKVHRLRDHSNILVADGGEVFGQGTPSKPNERAPVGQCSAGGQPA